MIKVFIVDDDPEFRRFLKEFLADKRGLKIIGEAANGKQALEKVEEVNPDLVLMDIRIPRMGGITASHLLKRKLPQLKIILLSIFDDPSYLDSVIENGVAGYVVKSNLVKDLLPAIRAALKNGNKRQFKGKSWLQKKGLAK